MAPGIDYSKWDKLTLSDSDDGDDDDKCGGLPRALLTSPKDTVVRGVARGGGGCDGGGLREFARAVQRAKDGSPPPKVCYVGGSVTAQVEGWRPRFHSLLERHLGLESSSLGHTLSAMGNVGSKVRVCVY